MVWRLKGQNWLATSVASSEGYPPSMVEGTMVRVMEECWVVNAVEITYQEREKKRVNQHSWIAL
jgi:hypothetical protein